VVDPHITLDGTNFVNVGKDEALYPTTEFTVGGYVNTEDWSSAVSNQLFGNYYNQGFGVFYNSGVDTDNLTLVDSTHGILLNINNDGRAYFQRELPVSGSDITHYVTDQRGVRSLMDSVNKNVYVVDGDSVDLHTISLSATADIVQMDVGPDNSVWLMNEDDCHVHWYDSSGNFILKTPYPAHHNNFAVKPDRSIVTTRTNPDTHVVLDCDGNYFYLLGQNIYKNGNIFYHVSPTVSNFNIDSDGNIWITYDENRMLKLAPSGRKLFDIKYHTLVTCARSYDECKPRNLQYFREKSSITFTRENLPDGSFQNFAWVLLKEYKYLLKLNEAGRLVKCTFLPDLINLSKIENVDVASLDFTAVADISDYRAIKSFSSLCDQDGEPYIQGRLATISPCGKVTTTSLSYDASLLTTGEHHFAMTFNGKEGRVRLFVDGAKVAERELDPSSVHYSYKPPFLIGAKSGKFNALQKERGLLRPVHFIGTFDDVRLYRKEFSEEDVNTLTKTRYNPKPLLWNIEISYGASYLEQIEQFFLHRPPGHKSNFFNVVVNNLGVESVDARKDIETKIRQRIDRIKPAHTQLHNIIFRETGDGRRSAISSDTVVYLSAFGGSYPFAAPNNMSWSEISGLAYSNHSDDIIIGIQDSGNSNEILFFSDNGRELASPSTGQTNTDWEDIATAVIDGINYIFVADVGNNAEGARTFHIERFIEPDESDIRDGSATMSVDEVITVDPDGDTPDFECLLVDPQASENGQPAIALITKRASYSAEPTVFTVDHQSSYSGTQSMTNQGTISGITYDSTEGYSAGVVGGDCYYNSDSGEWEVILKTYARTYRSTSTTSFMNAVMGVDGGYVENTDAVGHGNHPQALPKVESLAISKDGSRFIMASEDDGGEFPPMIIWGHSRASLTETSFQQGTSGYSGCVDTHVSESPTETGTNYSSATDTDIDGGAGGGGNFIRQALIHFDEVFVSEGGSIPDADVIHGGVLKLTVTNAGSGVSVHRMLEDWSADVGTMTWDDVQFRVGSAPITTDDVDAKADFECQVGADNSGSNVGTGDLWIPLSAATIESWKTANYGLLLTYYGTSGTNGLSTATSNNGTVGNRPELTIFHSS
jgi:hypothetical protein